MEPLQKDFLNILFSITQEISGVRANRHADLREATRKLHHLFERIHAICLQEIRDDALYRTEVFPRRQRVPMPAYQVDVVLTVKLAFAPRHIASKSFQKRKRQQSKKRSKRSTRRAR